MLEPGLGVVERLFVGEVEDHAGGLGECEVVVDNSAVSLLSGRVPEFQVKGGIVVLYLFEAVVDADSWLLRVVLAVDVAQQQRALAHGRATDDDGLVVAQGGVFNLTHSG